MSFSPSPSFRRTAVAVALVVGAVAGSVLATAGADTAGTAPPVTGDISAFLVTEDARGEERLTVADTAAPGQVMEFRIEFVNSSAEDVSGIAVVNPVPANTRFLPDSHAADVGADFEVSIDGGESFEPEPVTRIETQADGSQATVVVPPEQYTHVRWLADEPLAGDGGRQSFTYRVAVN